MVVNVLFGFDTERPYGPQARTDVGNEERKSNLEFISELNKAMDEQGAGRTFFILGDYLEAGESNLGANYLRQVFDPDNPLIEIGQHTQNHVTIAPIATRPDKEPVSPGDLSRDLTLANRTISTILNIDQANIKGLRTPLGYPYGFFKDRRNLLDTFKSAGLDYVSSALRSEEWGINAPFIESGQERQPFFYDNGLVELPSHGWQDSALTGTSKTKGTQNFPQSTSEIFDHYLSVVEEASRLSEQGQRPSFIGMCLHPWAVRAYDPKLEFMKRFMGELRNRDINLLSYGEASENFASAG